MEKRSTNTGAERSDREQRGASAGQQQKRSRKLTEYGRQLQEKQKVKRSYGMRERQFRRFFENAVKTTGATGEVLLSMLERRLDNTIYRLKFAATRPQARQITVHGHVLVNGKKVTAPSYIVEINDVITLDPGVAKKAVFVEQVIDKRLNSAVKVPEWLELNKADRKGIVLRHPVRDDIQAPIEEHQIVELYSK